MNVEKLIVKCFALVESHRVNILHLDATRGYLQLAILNEQICLSSGYNLRFIGHASVSEILILYSTEPYGKMRIYTFGMMILWKWPSFSFEKNKSGIQTRLASVNVRYLSRPEINWEEREEYC